MGIVERMALDSKVIDLSRLIRFQTEQIDLSVQGGNTVRVRDQALDLEVLAKNLVAAAATLDRAVDPRAR